MGIKPTLPIMRIFANQTLDGDIRQKAPNLAPVDPPMAGHGPRLVSSLNAIIPT
jgi:hypothetical protein